MQVLLYQLVHAAYTLMQQVLAVALDVDEYKAAAVATAATSSDALVTMALGKKCSS
jgi:hypothetical protein